MSAQRMTEEETQAVIHLWQAEQPGVADTPTLPDVAEGLDISVADTHRLLEQVRARRAEEEKLLAREQAEAELERIQLAEEERKLAEVRRQRAELQRQQAEAERLYQVPPLAHPVIEDDFSKFFKAVFVLIWLCIMIFIFSQIASSPGSPFHSSPEPSCALDNKPIPCSQMPFPIPPSQPH